MLSGASVGCEVETSCSTDLRHAFVSRFSVARSIRLCIPSESCAQEDSVPEAPATPETCPPEN